MKKRQRTYRLGRPVKILVASTNVRLGNVLKQIHRRDCLVAVI